MLLAAQVGCNGQDKNCDCSNCTSATSKTNPARSANGKLLGEVCSVSSECGEGLYCPTEEDSQSTCTADCTGDQLCDAILPGAFCVNGLCVKPCATRRDCGEHAHCYQSYYEDFCSAGTAWLSESCVSDEDCGEGLRCGQPGEAYAGYCTADCASTADCDSGYCLWGLFCTRDCTSGISSSCASGMECVQGSWVDLCIPSAQ